MNTYLILGGAGDIGRASAQLIKEWPNAKVVLASRDAQRAQQAAEALGVSGIQLDGTNISAVEKAAEQLSSGKDQLVGIVNCIGTVLLKPAHLTTEEEWRETIRVNLDSAFACVRAAGKTMRRSGGSVVFLSTCAVHAGLMNHEAIAAAKAGIEGLMHSAAATYAPVKIRFNAVAPGLVQTELTKMITKSETARKASLAMHPLGRLGEPEDIARAIAFLMDPANSWITNQVIHADGGLSSLRVPARV